MLHQESWVTLAEAERLGNHYRYLVLIHRSFLEEAEACSLLVWFYEKFWLPLKSRDLLALNTLIE